MVGIILNLLQAVQDQEVQLLWAGVGARNRHCCNTSNL